MGRWLGVLAALAALAADPAGVRQLRRGLGRDEVRKLVGPPDRVVRYALHNRLVEHWVYDGRPGVRVEFDGRRGEEAFVTAVRGAPPAKP